MAYLPKTIYHIYNQGNNKQIVFPNEKNYLFFLQKMRKHLLPSVDILAYCLMPNHFHLLIYTRAEACQIAISKKTGDEIHNQQVIAREIGNLLSSYTKAINKQEERTGSLFRLHTKYKECFYIGFVTIEEQNKLDYAPNCFRYIHENPVKANLVGQDTDWMFSSAKDYAQLRNGTLCNQIMAKELELF